MKLPLCVSLALNRCKVDMISDPYQYLFLILGFFQRGVPLFSYGFECCFYKKDVPIGEIVSCCSCVGGECSMDYRNTALKRSSWIMVTSRWKWNWRDQGGGTSMMKNLKRGWYVWVGGTSMIKTLKKVWGVSLWLSREENRSIWGGGGDQGVGEIQWWKNPCKGLRSVPMVLKNCPVTASLVFFVLAMINNELCPLMFSHHCLRRLRSLIYLPWHIRVSIEST